MERPRQSPVNWYNLQQHVSNAFDSASFLEISEIITGVYKNLGKNFFITEFIILKNEKQLKYSSCHRGQLK